MWRLIQFTVSQGLIRKTKVNIFLYIVYCSKRKSNPSVLHRKIRNELFVLLQQMYLYVLVLGFLACILFIEEDTMQIPFILLNLFNDLYT